MDIRFQAGGADKWKADIALIPIREGEKITDTCPELDSAAHCPGHARRERTEG